MLLSTISRRLFFSLLVLLPAIASLAVGCMWGLVRDADTGKPLAGVKVTLTDTQGQTLTTTAGANGLFGFGAPVSASPARGPISFQVDSPGYQPITETRDVLYDDNPAASFEKCPASGTCRRSTSTAARAATTMKRKFSNSMPTFENMGKSFNADW